MAFRALTFKNVSLFGWEGNMLLYSDCKQTISAVNATATKIINFQKLYYVTAIKCIKCIKRLPKKRDLF